MSSELSDSRIVSPFSDNLQVPREERASTSAADVQRRTKSPLPPLKRPRISNTDIPNSFWLEEDDLDNIEAELDNFRRIAAGRDRYSAPKPTDRPARPDLRCSSSRSRTLSPASRQGRKQHKFISKQQDFPQGQKWVEPTIPTKRSTSEARSVLSDPSTPGLDEGEELSLEKHRTQIAALIAKKRKENEASRFRQKLVRKQLAYLGVTDPSEQSIAEAHENLKRKMEASARGELDEEQESTALQTTTSLSHDTAINEPQHLHVEEDQQIAEDIPPTHEQATHSQHDTTSAESMEITVQDESSPEEEVIEMDRTMSTQSAPSPNLDIDYSHNQQYSVQMSQSLQPLYPMPSAHFQAQAISTEIVTTTSRVQKSTIHAQIDQPRHYAVNLSHSQSIASHQTGSNASLWTPSQHHAVSRAPDYANLQHNQSQWGHWTPDLSTYDRPTRAPAHPTQEAEPALTSSASISPAALAAMSIFGPQSTDASSDVRTVPSSFFGTAQPLNTNTTHLPRPPIVPSNMNMFSGQARESAFLGRSGLGAHVDKDERRNMFRS